MVDSSKKYFVARQQCKGKPLLHFDGKTEQFIFVTDTSTSTTVKRKRVFAFRANNV
jgi:hypothetical protein